MKEWVKVLMWLGFGAIAGYIVGDRMGYKRGIKEISDDEESCMPEQAPEEVTINVVEDVLGTYRGTPDPVEEDADDEAVKTPEKELEIDEDIPQLHPTHIAPEIIGEEEYNLNIWHYDLENLVFYSMDEVLYNETTQSIIENPDDVIGIGTLFEFGGDPNNPTDTIYVKNETYGVLFRIDQVDAAFCDAVDGTCGPEDDDDDDFTPGDYWGHV